MKALQKHIKWCLMGCCCLLFSLAQAQTVSGSFMHGGIVRNYAVYIPANYNAANAHPLVLNLHGYTSNGNQQAIISKMNSIADTAGFLVAYPEGTLDNSSNAYWNAGYGTSIDDIGFLSALIDTISSQYTVNAQRVYSTGYSNGGIMSHTLACELGHRIAAIASVAGTMSVLQQASCATAAAIPMLHIHGTLDGVVPYTGNTLLIGVDALVTHWVGKNGLPQTPVTQQLPNSNVLDNSTVTLDRYEQGSLNPVHLYRVDGGGHCWPGNVFCVSGASNLDFNASEVIWQFFNRFALTTSTEVIESKTALVKRLGANPVEQALQWKVKEEAPYTVTIFNALGQSLLMQTYHGSTVEALNVQHLKKGVYMAVFKTKEDSYTLKFVKA